MKISRPINKALSTLIISLLAAGCSQSDNPPSSKNSTESSIEGGSGSGSGGGVIPAHQLKTLQRAKDTEAMLLEKDRQRQQQLQQLQ